MLHRSIFTRLQSTAAKPIPVNLQAIYHDPLKLPILHGHLKADLQFRSYEIENLKLYTDFIQRVAFYLGIPMTGPKPLPTRRERWTVIRSPFVHAKSKENFERSTHKRLLRVWDTNDDLLEFFIAYITKHSVAGVGLKCNVYKREKVQLDWDHEKIPKIEDNQNDLVNSKIIELLNDPKFK
ncbi:hypothetical protein KAFR_0A01070 [Kazachstania africana CBS 2517]|uniref:Small ribosomal subunit protein uS10m n=1 Tax=Kazachstania africana (strain ATCC 22294 / BCRC 22015 / CBS 2517 / CECT 1963 / NBRC 1671 / NRRL Y-8276) TaxID=1071382 RepID=H2AME6_KAZAF|nr:hypothetical protein KAFR_0A01070 [Kazachstania africana CBS 2517]CCF55546.1 hypothetical protein KAFR_0A01070 [Kazachstania africana CBS 2517]